MSTETDVGAMTAEEWLERVFERGNRGKTWDDRHDGPNWFRCADGRYFSAVAGWGTYCDPRPDWPLDWGGAPADYAGPYTAVEVWFDTDDQPEGGVSVDDLRAFVAAHGGLAAYLTYPEQPDSAGWLGGG